MSKMVTSTGNCKPGWVEEHVEAAGIKESQLSFKILEIQGVPNEHNGP